MKIVLKATPAAMLNLFNALYNDSNTFNQMYIDDTTLLVLDNSQNQFDHLIGKGYSENLDGLVKPVVEYMSVKTFSWTTGSGANLTATPATGMVTIEGGRTAIRDRFSHALCVGWDPQGRECDLDWSNFDRAFHPGLELVSMETTMPEWQWWETQADHIFRLTGRKVWELEGKTASWLAASGLSSKDVEYVLSANA